MSYRFNAFTAIVMLLALAPIYRVYADWSHDFDGPLLPESWEVFVPPVLEQSSTFSAEASSGYLTIKDSVLPHLPGGAVVLLAEDRSERFSNVRVSGTVNVGPSLNNRLGLQLRGERGAYSFGVNFAAGPDVGTAWFVLPKGTPGPPLELNSEREFGIPTRLDIDKSYYLELDVIGDQLTGRVLDEKGGNELLSLSHTAPSLLGLGYAGVFAQHILDDIPVGGTFDDVSAIAIRPGDFDIDGAIDAIDIDLLSLEVRGGNNDVTFDLTGDGLVNQDDRHAWIENVFGTFLGDADLNKTVEFADFLQLSNHFGQEGGWGKGDFDGDGQIEFPDFLALSENFGAVSSDVAAAVPEPASVCLAMFATLGLIGFHRRRD